MTPEWKRMLEKFEVLEAVRAEFREGLRNLANELTTLAEVNAIIERQQLAQREFDDCWDTATNGLLRVKQ